MKRVNTRGDAINRVPMLWEQRFNG